MRKEAFIQEIKNAAKVYKRGSSPCCILGPLPALCILVDSSHISLAARSNTCRPALGLPLPPHGGLYKCINRIFRAKNEMLKEQAIFVGPLSRVRPRNGILALVVVVLVVVPLRSEFIGEL